MSELQLEFTSHKNAIEAKLTVQKLEHKVEEGKLAGQMMTLQNFYFSLMDRINEQKDWNKKYSDRISDLQKESSTCLKQIGGEK